MTPALLTKAEAAARARLSLRNFHTKLAEGDGPVVTRIGGRVFVRADHFDEWLERCASHGCTALHEKQRSNVFLPHNRGGAAP